MANKQAAIEWLTLSYHDLYGSILMFKAGHYTDTISYVIHQSIEKSLKSIFAFHNNPIKKTHNLIELYEIIPIPLKLTEEETLVLSVTTSYYSKQKYPNPNYTLPQREDIEEALTLAKDIINQICVILKIDPEEIKNKS